MRRLTLQNPPAISEPSTRPLQVTASLLTEPECWKPISNTNWIITLNYRDNGIEIRRQRGKAVQHFHGLQTSPLAPLEVHCTKACIWPVAMPSHVHPNPRYLACCNWLLFKHKAIPPSHSPPSALSPHQALPPTWQLPDRNGSSLGVHTTTLHGAQHRAWTWNADLTFRPFKQSLRRKAQRCEISYEGNIRHIIDESCMGKIKLCEVRKSKSPQLLRKHHLKLPGKTIEDFIITYLKEFFCIQLSEISHKLSQFPTGKWTKNTFSQKKQFFFYSYSSCLIPGNR